MTSTSSNERKVVVEVDSKNRLYNYPDFLIKLIEGSEIIGEYRLFPSSNRGTYAGRLESKKNRSHVPRTLINEAVKTLDNYTRKNSRKIIHHVTFDEKIKKEKKDGLSKILLECGYKEYKSGFIRTYKSDNKN